MGLASIKGGTVVLSRISGVIAMNLTPEQQ